MRAATHKIAILSLILLQSCAVVNQVFVENRQYPGPDASTAGIIGTSKPGGGLDEVKAAMISNCADWGGLNESSIMLTNPRGAKLFTDYWSYRCNGLNPQPSTTPSTTIQKPPANNQGDVATAKSKCIELGFKTGTERFGNCVLQLSK